LRRGANLEDRSDWRTQHAWLREKLETLHRVFGPVVRQLNPSGVANDSEVTG